MTVRFVTGPMRARLKKAMKAKPVLAAVAYVTDVNELPLGKGDTLACDAMSGSTDPKAMRALLGLGVRVFSRSGLHAKVIVAGKRAIVGSSNWSQNSEGGLIEASLDTDDLTAVKAAAAFVRKQAKGADVVNEAFIKGMPELKNGFGLGKKPPPKRLHGQYPATWLMATYPLVGHSKFRKKVEAEIATLGEVLGPVTLDWMRWDPGEFEGERMDEDDRFVMIWHPGGGEKVEVYPPAQIVRKVNDGTDLYVIYAGAANHDNRGISWRRFKTLASKVGLPVDIQAEFNDAVEPGGIARLLKKWPVKAA